MGCTGQVARHCCVFRQACRIHQHTVTSGYRRGQVTIVRFVVIWWHELTAELTALCLRLAQGFI